MYRGNPHQDRNPFKSFTGGFQQGWQDRRRGLNTGAHESMHGPLNPSGIQLAELTQEQMDFMGSPYNTPAFGVSKEDLWNRTKGMEKKGFFGWGAQEPTTTQEFNDYYNQLEQGEAGNWLAMAGKKKGINSTIPIGPTLTPGYNSIWDMQEENYRQNNLGINPDNTGYRYNKYGIVPLNLNAYS